MPKKSYSTPEINVEEAVNHINRYSLPYGLCKGVGIDTDGMTPREAWEAWENKTGKTKAQAEKEHWGNTADGEEPKKAEEPKKETPAAPQKSEEAKATTHEKEEPKTAADDDHKYISPRGSVSEDYARRAKEMRSFSDYKAGSATGEYNASVSRFESNVNELIEKYGKNQTLTDKDWEDVHNIADRYSAALSRYTDETNRTESSYPSWMIAGPARYNVKKNEALMNRSMKLYDDYKDRIDPDNNIYLNKIRAILTNASIKSNDDAATVKLQDKYDKLKTRLENGKAMNAYFRKNGTLVGFQGITEESAKKWQERHDSGEYGFRQPFMPYELQNGNAELRRIQARIEQLNKAKAEQESARANPEAAKAATAARYPKVDGVSVEENADDMRIQLRFDDIPPAETREKLKRYGFKWSQKNGAWQRMLNDNGKRSARWVLEDLGGKK